MFQYKKRFVIDLNCLIRGLSISSAAILLTGCANQIELGKLSEKCNKESSIEKLNSPALEAKNYYVKNYGQPEDENDDDAHENCKIAIKQIGLNTDSDPYKKFQNEINTRQCYHDAVLAFGTWETNHSLYLLGIEKPRNKNSEKPYQLTPNANTSAPSFVPTLFSSTNPLDEDAVTGTQTYIKKTLNDDRPMVLTHILKVKSSTNGTNSGECFVYDAYANTESDKNTHPWCSKPLVTNSGINKKWTENGWQALDQLGKEIREEINQKTRNNKAPTHIIMLATGWNTREYESFLDFKKWMDELQKNFEKNNEAFNPIFIGIASELEWSNEYLPDWLSEPTKERDADEIGFTWANYLLNSILKPIAKETKIPIVGIGHSFGSRIILGSHYARHIFSGYSESMENVPVTLIGMQAAFPTGRFNSTRGGFDTFSWWPLPPSYYKNNPYLTANKGAATVVITTSKSDKATGTWLMTSGYLKTGFIGGRGGLSELENYPDDYKSAIRKFDADEKGRISNEPDKNLVSLYDASNFVNCEIPATESGSHSDVYDEPMGNFLGQIIRATSNNKK